jgi:tetratricopeptide (TPR) repeat protein
VGEPAEVWVVRRPARAQTGAVTRSGMSNIEILRGELERLFSLEELTSLSDKLLGLDPKEVGGASAKGSFAKALTERCVDGERLEALVDVILASRSEVDPRVRDIGGLLGSDELAPGTELGPYVIEKRLGMSELGVTYAAKKNGRAFTLKTLRREAARDRRAVHRFLTANRLVASIKHPGLPQDIDAGELHDRQRGTIFYVAYELIDAPSLAQRLARMGANHVNELRPLLRGVLEPLAALHKAQLVHGDLKLDHVLLPKPETMGGEPRVVLIDFGGDRLRPRLATMNGGGFGFLAVFGSPKTIAPEQVRGRPSDARTDVYSFGAMVYELLSGKPVFATDNPTDAAFAHVSQKPEAPSAKAPRGWISKEIDDWVLSMLAKDPAQRPRDASALLDTIERVGRAAATSAGAGGTKITPDELDALVSMLQKSPDDSDAAISLEKAIDQGADAQRVAEAFAEAAGKVTGDDAEYTTEAKKALLFRAARIYDGPANDKAKAEATYLAILEIDSSDEIAIVALEEVRKALGKFEEIVEMLLARSETASAGEERARVMAEIGRLYTHELDDAEQALVAYTQAFCEDPVNDEYVASIERIAGQNAARWAEVLGTVTEGVKNDALSASDRSALLARAGKWYDEKAKRPDMALMAYQQILVSEPSSEAAQEGLTVIYRRAQQWPELAQVLLARADAAATTPRARDLRSEAAELFEMRLNDLARAKEIYREVALEDPGHTKASDALARIAEREGDFQTLVGILERRAEARRGTERADAMVRVAEVYEDHLNDLGQATQRFEEALALDPAHLGALKGLDRVFNRTGKYRELLEVLERQIAVAATPRQKINLYERMAAIHDEEFLDQAKAAECLEQVLAMDPSNDGALTALPRFYRVLNRWEDAVKLYERHAAATSDDARRVELVVAKARMLSEQIGSPERAIKTFEQVLVLEPGHAGALEALAALKESSGDAHAALSAIESLAAKASTPEAKAEQWIRAARLLDARGDKDGAIERYKMALESNPKDAAASAALRQAYGQRGDYASVLTLIDKELATVEGDLAKARLFGEQAKVYLTKLKEDLKAEQMARRALELDGTNADAHLVLGDLSYEAGRMVEASKHYESLAGRSGALPKDDAVRALVRYVESMAKANPPPSSPEPRSSSTFPVSGVSDSLPPASSPSPRVTVPPTAATARILTAVEALQRLAPDDVHSLATAARVLLDQGDASTARKVYGDLVQKHDAALGGSERAEVLYGLGESMRRLGEYQPAIPLLTEASQVDPSSPLPLRALAKLHEDRGEWAEAVKAKKRRLDVATGQERFDLLIEIGDVFLHKLSDRTLASKTYVAALEEKPDDRKLLTRLMQLYSEEKDWAKLVDVVVRLADFVEDPKQRAKYMQTAAIVSARQLGERKQALQYYDRALEFDPSLTKAVDEALELRRQEGDHDGVERMLKMQIEQAKEAGDRAKLTQILDQLGELYQKFLSEPDLAVDAYEAAQAFDPENKQRGELLAELYASDLGQYLDKAVKAQAQILRRNPYRVESYKLLRKLFTEAQKADAAWCLCQALSVMNLAEPDEERFFKRHKSESAAPAKAAFDANDWDRIAHYDQDALLTRIFAAIQPTVIRARSQAIEAMGYDARYAIDLTRHPYPVSQTLYYAAGVLGIAPPPVFQNPNDPAGLGFLHATMPSIVLGRAAFEAQVAPQSLAFLAGRHLAFFRPGYYVRQLIPTGTGLKAWLFAAIKLCVPQFPIAPDVQGAVGDAMAAMQGDFLGAHKEKLASLGS